MKGGVYTVGVYGRSDQGFFDLLRKSRIDVLVDIRLRRGMRGKEHAWANSQALQATLKRLGIGYLHAKEWAPTPEMLKTQHEYDVREFGGVRKRKRLAPGFERAYRKILKEHSVKELLDLIREQFGEGPSICLFCVEDDHRLCHRSILAEEVSRVTRAKVVHL